MAKVRVPRKNVTAAELITVLDRRLPPGYRVEGNGNGRVQVRKSSLAFATVSVSSVPGASVFRVRSGIPVASWGTSRRVADVLSRSPEFRSL
jgi:hypothetical protein